MIFEREANSKFSATTAHLHAVLGGSGRKFEPALEMKRWGDSSLLFGIPAIGHSAPKMSHRTGVITSIAKDGHSKANFYTLPQSAHYESGIEVEWVLGSKPASNKIPFRAEHDGLEFYYQPELTAAEIAAGHARPECVVGSLAVYAKGKRNNKYQTGKHTHLLRPTATDKCGRRINGVWEPDLTNGLIYAVFDGDWLSRAVYPVTIGPSLGKVAQGLSTFPLAADSIDSFGPYALAVNGTATQFNYWNNQTVFPDVKAGIYLDSAGLPSTLVASTAGAPPGGAASPEIKSVAISAALLAGSSYWPALLTDGNLNLYYDAGGNPPGQVVHNRSYASGMSNPFGSNDFSNGTLVSAYIDYTAVGPADPFPNGYFREQNTTLRM